MGSTKMWNAERKLLYFLPVHGGEFELDACIGHSSENRAVFSTSVEDYSFQLKAS